MTIFKVYDGHTIHYDYNRHLLCPVGYDFFTEYVILGFKFRKIKRKVRL